MSNPKFYLTTPIYYVNARPHIGHAYTTIVADVIARRHRLLGHDTYFLTGTDEHGQKIERSALAAGVPPQLFTDQVSEQFRSLWQRMGLTYDQYIRTTDEKHKRGAQKLFATLYERGHIYLDSYTGAYCVSDEAFVDLPVGTPCPDCGRLLEQVTEENFFFRLSDFQLDVINLIESDRLVITPDAAKNEVLSFLRGNIKAALADYPLTIPDIPLYDFGAPESDSPPQLVPAGPDNLLQLKLAEENGILGRSKSGEYYVIGALKDLSVSRSSFTWGIPVPEVAAIASQQKHVIYVWLDALTNYMSAVGYGSDAPEDQAMFERFWPADLHLVGKEITRFHCVYWPAFLMAAGLPTPKQITANGWLLFDNSKMSKSKGNVVRTETILDAFGSLCPPPAAETALLKGTASAVPQNPAEDAALAAEVRVPSKHDQDLFGADVLRYHLLREIPFGQDGSFSFEAMVTRYNADLANGYGNLVSRTLKLVQQNFPEGWIIPATPWLYPEVDYDKASDEETSTSTFYIFDQCLDCVDFIDSHLGSDAIDNQSKNKFNNALEAIMFLVGAVDAYLSFHKPWALAKSDLAVDRQRLVEVLYTASEAIRIITVFLYPILPYATANVWRQLGLGDIEQAAKTGKLASLHQKIEPVSEQPKRWGGLKAGEKLGPLSPIFPRADKGLIQIMTDVEFQNAPKSINEPTPGDGPDAAPRTASIPEPNPGALVAGSAALTTKREATPPTGEENVSPQITIDDFAKIDLRVAQILVAERIPKADKLLRLEVDLGYEKRQILSGIAEFYTPEELVGRRIVVIANLAPRKMRGLESHGMLLAASETDHGKPALATCGDEIALGSRLK